MSLLKTLAICYDETNTNYINCAAVYIIPVYLYKGTCTKHIGFKDEKSCFAPDLATS